MNRIRSMREIVPNTYELVVEAPEAAAAARPGNFAIVIPDEKSERIPITIADWDAREGTVTLFFLEVGVSTMKLARKKPGDTIDFVAPLGKPATIKKFGTVFIGGGCYGVGAILPVVRAMKEAENRVLVAIEARSGPLLYREAELRRHADLFFTTTSDGSSGTKGKARGVLRRLVAGGEKVDAAYFMGCTFMMMLAAQECKSLGIPSLVYLNPLMLDATGMCGVCRVRVGGQVKFACVDGPEFEGAEVEWEDLFNRNKQYLSHQMMAYQQKCKTARGGG